MLHLIISSLCCTSEDAVYNIFIKSRFYVFFFLSLNNHPCRNTKIKGDKTIRILSLQNLQHHTVYAAQLIILSLLMPANSCHGHGEALGGGGVWLQMLEEEKQLRQREEWENKINKWVQPEKNCSGKKNDYKTRREICHKYIISDVGKAVIFLIHTINRLFMCALIGNVLLIKVLSVTVWEYPGSLSVLRERFACLTLHWLFLMWVFLALIWNLYSFITF